MRLFYWALFKGRLRRRNGQKKRLVYRICLTVMRYKAIVAMSYNRVIGKDNAIPWRISEDLKFFKKLTMGHILVMGRKTYDSVGVLPGRSTIVVSRSKTKSEILASVEVVDNLEKLTALIPNDGRNVFICGGAEIYNQTLDLCSEIYLTTVKQIVEGDAFFPVFSDSFKLVEEIENNERFMIQRFNKE